VAGVEYCGWDERGGMKGGKQWPRWQDKGRDRGM